MQDFEKIRKHPRAPVSILVGVREGNQFYFENSLEISEGGMLLNSPKSYDPGDRMELILKLPYSDQVTVIGEVIYLLNEPGSNRNRGVGIRFVSPAPEVQEIIRKYVEYQRTQIV